MKVLGVYVQAPKPKLTPEQRQQLEQCFRMMDADGSGSINAPELAKAFHVRHTISSHHTSSSAAVG